MHLTGISLLFGVGRGAASASTHTHSHPYADWQAAAEARETTSAA